MSSKDQQENTERLVKDGVDLEIQKYIEENAKLGKIALQEPEKYRPWIDEIKRMMLETRDELDEYYTVPQTKGGQWQDQHIAIIVLGVMQKFYAGFGIEIPAKWVERERLMLARAREIADKETEKPEDAYVEDETDGIGELNEE